MKNYLLSIALLTLLVACDNHESLQKYFVSKSEDKNFISLDISPSILNIDKTKLTPEQSKALASFNKMNVLAFKADASNAAEYQKERKKVTAILKDPKYQQLMKFGSGQDGASVSFIGDENHIDEFVLFANKKENGFAVVRILGNNMNPNGIVTMMTALKNSNVNMKQLEP